MSRVEISLNKNAVYGDKSATSPGGARNLNYAMTTRGCKEGDFIAITNLIHQCVILGLKIQEGHKKLADFKKNVNNYTDDINTIKQQVYNFTSKFEFIEI